MMEMSLESNKPTEFNVKTRLKDVPQQQYKVYIALFSTAHQVFKNEH